MRWKPFKAFPVSGFEAAGCAILGFETVLDNLELEWADGGEEGDFLQGVADFEDLDNAFLEELIDALAELFKFSGVGIVEIGETF